MTHMHLELGFLGRLQTLDKDFSIKILQKRDDLKVGQAIRFTAAVKEQEVILVLLTL